MLDPAIEAALRASWGAETCDPVDLPWSDANPSCGQCGVTAAVIQELAGGDLLCAEVLHADGTRQGFHYWNRLPDDTELDLTRDQFRAGEQIQPPTVVEQRPVPGQGRLGTQHAELLTRVRARL